jgi:hypothetical protein
METVISTFSGFRADPVVQAAQTRVNPVRSIIERAA